MKLYGLFGISGSGKSYHAAQIAEGIGADWIIDDGLLIHRDRVMAGFSAKFELNKIASIRRAVFTEDAHRDQVHDIIAQYPDAAVLILGTSQKMIRTIVERLGLTGKIEWLDIREICKEEDIAAAAAYRAKGMHAIPVTQSQLVEFAPNFLRRILKNAHLRRPSGNRLGQHMGAETGTQNANRNTIVYPLFTKGAIFVHPHAVRDSIKFLLASGEHPFTLKTVDCDTHTADIHVHVDALWNREMRIRANDLLFGIQAYLRDFLGFPYAQVFLHIDTILPPGKSRRDRH